MNNLDQKSISDPFVKKTTITPYFSGILSGLFFAVKDNIDIANENTGYGSPSWSNTHLKPVSNSICIEQLLNEGACYVGKTKSDELAYSLIGVNHFYGTPLNPKAPDRAPGGSSSGSASAVASELVDFALGTDTGGSIRVPASNCGVWGYRPSHGVISVSGVLPLAPSFDTVGVIAKTGEILEKVMRVLLAENNHGINVSPIIYLVDDVFQIADSRIIDKTKPFLNKISDFYKVKTAKLSEVTAPHINCGWLFEQLGASLSPEIWNTFGAWIKKVKPKLSSEVEYNLHSYAESANRKDIQSTLHARKTFQDKMYKFLCNATILCFPTTVDLAPKLDRITPEFLAGDYIPKAMGVNAISSLSCLPQITIPVAGDNGVPAGLSFMAGYKQDMKLINICNQIYTQCLI